MASSLLQLVPAVNFYVSRTQQGPLSNRAFRLSPRSDFFVLARSPWSL